MKDLLGRMLTFESAKDAGQVEKDISRIHCFGMLNFLQKN